MKLPEFTPAAFKVLATASIILGTFHLLDTKGHQAHYYHHPSILSGVTYIVLGTLIIGSNLIHRKNK